MNRTTKQKDGTSALMLVIFSRVDSGVAVPFAEYGASEDILPAKTVITYVESRHYDNNKTR